MLAIKNLQLRPKLRRLLYRTKYAEPNVQKQRREHRHMKAILRPVEVGVFIGQIFSSSKRIINSQVPVVLTFFKTGLSVLLKIN